MSYADIIVGAARVHYAPVGEALPDESSVAYGGSWGGNWTEIALTKTPFTMASEMTTFDVMVEQSTLPIKRPLTEEKVTFETVLSEFLADHLALGMEVTTTTTAAGVGQVGFDAIEFGGQATLTERAWGIEGLHVDSSGNQLPVRLFIYRATAVLNGPLTFAKGEELGIPLQITGLADTSKAAGKQLGIIHHVTAPAT